MKDPQENLQAHRTVAFLQSNHSVSSHSGSVCELCLREAAELAPRLDVTSQVALGSADRERGGGLLRSSGHNAGCSAR